MKFLFSYLILFCAFISPSVLARENFTGGWYGEILYENKETPASTFELQLTQHGEKITGRYCFITQYGNRIDCINTNEVNINGLAKSEFISFVTFNSTFGGRGGKARLTIDGDNLKWKMLTPPTHGDYYVPKEYVLLKKATMAHSSKTLKTRDYIVKIINNCGLINQPCNSASYLGIRNSDNNVINLTGKTFSYHNDVVYGYEFINGDFAYRIYLNTATIELRKNNKIVFSQKGEWEVK